MTAGNNVVPIGAAKSKRKEPPPPREGWERELILNDRGEPKRCLANVLLILACDPRWSGVIAYDDFAKCVVTQSAPPARQTEAPTARRTGEWSEEDSIRTAAWLTAEHGIDAPTTMVDQAVSAIAHRNVVHPVRDWMRGLTWDECERLPTMLSVYFGAADGAYTRGVGVRWMISGVARIFEPGCQADCTLVLEGAQGTGKSTGLEAFVPVRSWFADTGIILGDKDSYQALRRKLIYELSEMASVKGREIERVKAFLSARTDSYRPSYGRRNVDHPRQVIFAATTNESAYLIDSTGNRRFWPVRCSQIDVEGIRRDRDQLWAEARVRYDRGEAWHVDSGAFARLCAEEQEGRVLSDPWTEIVARWLEAPTVNRYDVLDGGRELVTLNVAEGLMTSDVLVGALGRKAGEISRSDESRVGVVLRDLGFESRQRREGAAGQRVRRYFPSRPAQPVTTAPAKGS
jgi:putative DNA primase/helicase